MKKLILFLVLILAVTLCLAHALADPEDYMGQTLPDFSAITLDGSTFTLSECLKTHDLVLINLWATWCGPCRMEFPYLEQAWEQYGGRVYVIALSIEEEDTLSVLESFAVSNDLTFAIGRDDAHLFDMLNGSAIPTTLIVNKDRTVVSVEIGAKLSAEEFTTEFDVLLSQYGVEEAEEWPRCILHFCDNSGNPIPGVMVGFCNGEYDPVESDATGSVYFYGDPNEYHVHLLNVPNGYALPWTELYIYGQEYELTVTLYPD